jgi:DNA-binding beta-propeller fold protein YncE
MVMINLSKKILLFSLIFGIFIAINGCATAPPPKEEPKVFYPNPPNPPRLQYLTSFTSSKDIEPPKSGFELFVVGKETIMRLDKPYGLAVYDGKIYVADTNATIMVFDLEKKTLKPLSGAQGLGKLLQPLNLCIDKEGNKYVVDRVRAQVVVFDKNDFYVKAYGSSREWGPTDCAILEDRLYVVDINNAEVHVLDKNTGNLIRKIGRTGESVNWLIKPTNIAIDKDGVLYVSDASRFQIVKYNRDGYFLGTIGRLGVNLGHFARPRGVAVDREGRVYVVDAAFDNVQIFDNTGQLLTFFSKYGRGPGDLYLPAKVVVDYDHIKYFRNYADPDFDIEYLVFVSSQFGDRLINVYAFGKKKGERYPTDEELREELKKEIEKKFKTQKKPEEKPNEQ